MSRPLGKSLDKESCERLIVRLHNRDKRDLDISQSQIKRAMDGKRISKEVRMRLVIKLGIPLVFMGEFDESVSPEILAVESTTEGQESGGEP